MDTKTITPATQNGKDSSKTITLPVTPAAKAKPASFEDYMLNLNQKFELQAKFEKLAETEKKLNGFTIKGTDRCKIIIEDEHGDEFTTSNSDVIARTIVFLKTVIAEKCETLKSELMK